MSLYPALPPKRVAVNGDENVSSSLTGDTSFEVHMRRAYDVTSLEREKLNTAKTYDGRMVYNIRKVTIEGNPRLVGFLDGVSNTWYTSGFHLSESPNLDLFKIED